jgi:hypothetical protein
MSKKEKTETTSKNTVSEQMEERLKQGIREVYESENWTNYLNLNKNFANYSWRNKLLVFLQKPDATLVKGYKTWKNEYGRLVDKGQKAIFICAPKTSTKTYTTEDIMKKLEDKPDSEFWSEMLEQSLKEGSVSATGRYFSYIPVFDVSQTSGKELPPHSIREALSESVDDYESVLRDLMDVAPEKVTISFSSVEKDSHLDNAYGYFRPTTNEIVLRDNMSESMTIKVLVHEMAHSMLHGEEMLVEGVEDTSKITARDLKEIQAESVAYIVCSELGIDSSKESFGYVADYMNEDFEKLSKCLDAINKCSNQIIDSLSVAMDKEKGIEIEGMDER